MRDPSLIPLVLAVVSLGCNYAAFAQPTQKFPGKPVRLVVGFSHGSATDGVARTIGQRLSEVWGQPVVVENRSGGGGTIGAGMVAKAAPDGYTLLVTPASFASSAAMHGTLPYDPRRDFAGVTRIVISTQVLLVPLSLGTKSVRELIALATASPGKIIFGSSGFGSVNHMSGELFRLVAGITVVHVAYKGGQELIVEMLGGRMHYAFMGLAPPLPLIRDGRLLALAVSPERTPLLPGVPAITETLSEYRRPPGGFDLLAPAGTPRPVLDQVSKDVARIVSMPDVKDRMMQQGMVPSPTTPREHDTLLHAQIDAFSELAAAAGLRPR